MVLQRPFLVNGNIVFAHGVSLAIRSSSFLGMSICFFGERRGGSKRGAVMVTSCRFVVAALVLN